MRFPLYSTSALDLCCLPDVPLKYTAGTLSSWLRLCCGKRYYLALPSRDLEESLRRPRSHTTPCLFALGSRSTCSYWFTFFPVPKPERALSLPRALAEWGIVPTVTPLVLGSCARTFGPDGELPPRDRCGGFHRPFCLRCSGLLFRLRVVLVLHIFRCFIFITLCMCTQWM